MAVELDWDADRPKLESRLRELSFPPKPLVWIRTAHLCPEAGATRFIIIACISPTETHCHFHETMLGSDLFTREWSGHHYEAIGLLRRYSQDGRLVDETAEDLP